jgi:hypothetical protein
MGLTQVLSYGGTVLTGDYFVGPVGNTWLSLPDVTVDTANRVSAHPVVSGIRRDSRKLSLAVVISGGDYVALRDSLLDAFDPDDETSKKLVIGNDGGENRYVYAICERIKPAMDGGVVIPRCYEVEVVVDGDVRWRSDDESLDSWTVTSSGATKTISNDGDCDAYPVFTITPNSNKVAGNGFTYKRWCPVLWKSTATANNYPVLLGTLNTAALVSAGKAQSDGDDFRVYVDGEETGRWFGSSGTSQFNQSATKTWINLNFSSMAQVDLGGGIADSGDVDEIEAGGSIAGFPARGILLIEDEAFVYTDKSNVSQKFLGVTRATKGTSAAAHVPGATIRWIQHDVWIYYGDSSLGSPSVNDLYRPPFDLDSSTNSTWDFDASGDGADGFGRDGGLGMAQWMYSEGSYSVNPYHVQTQYFYQAKGDRGDINTNPWTEIGIVQISGNGQPGGYGVMTLYNPCGITAANFQGGEHYQDYAYWAGSLRSSSDGNKWTVEYDIPMPTPNGSWDTWSQDLPSLPSGTLYIQLRLSLTYIYVQYSNYLECSDVAVTLNSTYTPGSSIGDELSNYQLAATIENTTTGESIVVSYGIALDVGLMVDTDARVVIYLEDGSGQLQAVSFDTVRRDWLKLRPGSNVLKYTETGVQNVSVDISWRERYFT